MKTCGLVLAGGKSSRYGKQKLFETINGQPLYQKSINAMHSAGLESVYIVTNRELAPAFTASRIPMIIEPSPHGGPLQALYTAMEKLSMENCTWFQVLAGDLPYIDGPTVQTILGNASNQTDIVLPKTGSRDQPLHAGYHKRCLPIIRELLPRENSMKALYKRVQTYPLIFADDHPGFININRPEDWKKGENYL